MEQQTKNLIIGAVENLAQTTGIRMVYKPNVPKAGRDFPAGFVRIDYKNMHWDFAIQTKARVTRTTVAIEKIQPTLPGPGSMVVAIIIRTGCVKRLQV